MQISLFIVTRHSIKQLHWLKFSIFKALSLISLFQSLLQSFKNQASPKCFHLIIKIPKNIDSHPYLNINCLFPYKITTYYCFLISRT